VLRLTPQLARCVLIPASSLVFLAGLIISGTIFYRGKPFDVEAAVISDLESPDENPHGYGAAAAGTAVAGVLLVPAAIMFYQRLRKDGPALALAGAALFAMGLGAAIAIGVLAPFTRGYSPLHIQLAFATFIGICGGASAWLFAARAARVLVVFQSAVFLFLGYLYFTPDFFQQRPAADQPRILGVDVVCGLRGRFVVSGGSGRFTGEDNGGEHSGFIESRTFLVCHPEAGALCPPKDLCIPRRTA